MEIEYCWRFKEYLPLLNESEWDQISPLLENTIGKIKAYRAEHGCDIPTARAHCGAEAVAKFEQITGYRDINYDAIFYLRRINYGPKCLNCGKLFRTPRARYCASCGAGS